MWSNFHTHCSYCDGKGSLTDYAAKAEELRMLSLGFSSHAPLPFDCRWCMKPEQLVHYLNDIRQLKAATSTDLYASLEIDYIPGRIGPDNFKDQLDYTIGSIHFVEALPSGVPFEIDGTHDSFLEGLRTTFKNDIRRLTTRYYELTREMVTSSTPTLVGHLDKIKMQNTHTSLFNESEAWYVDEIEKTLDVIASYDCIVEVNTRGLYQRKTMTPYPSPWILERIAKRKIPVTLSTDAHHPGDLINRFDDTASLLYSLGFRELRVLHKGQWKSLPFTEHGLVL